MAKIQTSVFSAVRTTEQDGVLRGNSGMTARAAMLECVVDGRVEDPSARNEELLFMLPRLMSLSPATCMLAPLYPPRPRPRGAPAVAGSRMGATTRESAQLPWLIPWLVAGGFIYERGGPRLC